MGEKDIKVITVVHHIALILSSEECLAFYKRLGFTEIFRKEREYDNVVLLDGYGIQLEVFIDSRHPGRGEMEPLGPRHFALQVSDPLEMEIEGLRAEDIKTDWLGHRFVFIRDPDGNVVELHE